MGKSRTTLTRHGRQPGLVADMLQILRMSEGGTRPLGVLQQALCKLHPAIKRTYVHERVYALRKVGLLAPSRQYGGDVTLTPYGRLHAEWFLEHVIGETA